MLEHSRVISTEQDALDAIKTFGFSPDALKQNCVLSSELQDKLAEYDQARQKYIPLIANYRPNAEQWLFHNTLKPLRICVGGNQSGKTKVCIEDSCFHLLREYPPGYTGRRYGDKPIRIRHCATSHENGLDDIIIPYYKSHLPKGFIREPMRRNSCGQIVGLDTYFNDYVQFMSCKQDLDQFAGPQFDEIYEDEPPPKDIHDENIARTSMPMPNGLPGRVSIAATVLYSSPWIYDCIYDPEMRDVLFYIEFTTEKNPAMTPEAYKILVSKWGSDEDSRNARLYGKPVFLSGVLFKEFSPRTHVRPWFETKEPNFIYYMGCDPHGRKSWCLVWWAVNRKGQKFIVEEAYRNLHTYKEVALMIALKEQQITADEHQDMLRWPEDAVKQELCGRFWGNGKGIIIWGRIMDTSGWERDARTSRPKADELADYGITFEQANKSEKSAITTLRQWLSPSPEPELFILDNCGENIFQFQHTVYEDWRNRVSKERNDKPERIRSKRSDFIDLAKYMANLNPQWMFAGSPDDAQRADSAPGQAMDGYAGFASPYNHRS